MMHFEDLPNEIIEQIFKSMVYYDLNTCFKNQNSRLNILSSSIRIRPCVVSTKEEVYVFCCAECGTNMKEIPIMICKSVANIYCSDCAKEKSGDYLFGNCICKSYCGYGNYEKKSQKRKIVKETLPSEPKRKRNKTSKKDPQTKIKQKKHKKLL